MAKKDDNKGFVEHLTPRDTDFAQWYTDVILKTDMVDYGPVRGSMVMRPYGFRVWELIQSELDLRLKATGHENVYMPLLIPESLLEKEKDHIEGFAPEVLWVTHGGTEELSERLLIRPTSETLFGTMYAKWVQSYRDLPMLYNQWCNVVRWEKTTRPFLRTCEFLWQEGHTVHETPQEAKDETLNVLELYREFCENALALPLFVGKKSEKEKFAGALETYSIEAMMQDGKSLQAGTTHYFGDKFAQVFGITFLGREGKQEYPSQSSWGVSTRLIGALIMAHGDDRGLVMPPKVAPVQVVIIPVAQHKEGVLDKNRELLDRLKTAGVRAVMDDDDTQSVGWKFNCYELKGVPVRLEVGPRDMENGVATVMRRDTLEKFTLPLDNIEEEVTKLLGDIHTTMFNKAKAFKEANTTQATTMEELNQGVQSGFVLGAWCGEETCENAIREQTGATTRNIPMDETKAPSDKCICCGKQAKTPIYFAKAY